MTSNKTLPGGRLRRLALASAALWLTGCASLSPDGGLQPVRDATRQHLDQELALPRDAQQQDELARRVQELLAQPLSERSAVQVALLNNRGLRASLHALGVADADRVQASRLPNPGFSFARLRKGDEREIERGFTLDLAHVIALPLARRVEDRRFAALQRATVMEVLALAAETRKAYVAAVAAEQMARYQQDVRESAEAGAELAARLARIGNFSKLQQAREQGFHSEAVLNAARAEQARVAARERLTRLLGLWGAQTQFQLPERLPDLPQQPDAREGLEQLAMAQRLDVQAARAQMEATAHGLGLTRVTRLASALELGWTHNTSNEAPRQTGWEIGFEIPLFDWGEARSARAESLYLQSANRAVQTAIEARSEVREAYLGYRAAYDIARHYRDEVVPAAKRVSDENLLRYNGMFISVFELLADARAQIAAVNASIAAQRDFWTAQADLDMALIGKPSLAALAAPGAAAPGNAAAGH